MESAEEHFDNGNRKLIRKDLDGAFKDYSTAIGINPNLPISLIIEKFLKNLIEDNDKKVENHRIILEIKPYNLMAIIRRAFAFIDLNSYRESVSFLPRIIDINVNWAMIVIGK